MATCNAFQVQLASVMEVVTKTALAEITKLFDDAAAELRLEMSRSQRENEALKSKLLVMEGELRTARGCGDGAPDSSLNIAFEVKVCNELGEAQTPKVAAREGNIVAVERVFEERLRAGPARGENVAPERKEAVPDILEIKYEPVDGEQVWSESVLLSEDWLDGDPKTSESHAEQNVFKETSRGHSTSEGPGQPADVSGMCTPEEEDVPGVQMFHQRVHIEEKSLLCKLCGKLVDGVDSLKQHHMTHHGEKRFSCALCGKGFATKRNVQTHQRIHTGEKPYSCDECGKSFAQLCNLKTHRRVHTGEKPYVCMLCGKSFSQSNGLQKHTLSHSW